MQNNKKIFVSHYRHSDIPSGFGLVLLSECDKIKSNSIDEIFLRDVIGSFSDINIDKFIELMVDKLSINGVLYIQDLDIEQTIAYMSKRILPVVEKNILYANNRNNIFYMRQLTQLLQKISNISIEKLNFVNGYEFFIQIKKHA